MTPEERDDVIDDCMRAVLSLRVFDPYQPERRYQCDSCGGEQTQFVDVITGAACYRLMQLKSDKGKR